MNGLGDIRLTPEGDFGLNENYEIEMASRIQLIEQTLYICIKTTNPDWFYDAVGADLEDLLGLPNTRETAEKGMQQITRAILQSRVIEAADLHIEAKPTGKSTITFLIFVRTDELIDPIVFRADLELGTDIAVRRIK